MPQLDPITVTIPEASRLTNLSVTTIYAKIAEEILESTVVGKRRLVFYASLVAMMEAGRSLPSATRNAWKPPVPGGKKAVDAAPASRRMKHRDAPATE